MAATRTSAKRGQMTVHADDHRLRTLIENATRMAQEPWLWSRADLKRTQRILRSGGYRNLADELQTFIDEPALPLGRRARV